MNPYVGVAAIVMFGAVMVAINWPKQELQPVEPVNEHVAAAVKECLAANGLPRYTARNGEVGFSCSYAE